MIDIRQRCSKINYVRFDNLVFQEGWIKMMLKIKGVYDDIGSIDKALHINRVKHGQNSILLQHHDIDPLFTCTQLLKQAI